MARPNQTEIEKFMKITGSTEAIAVQMLMEHRYNVDFAIMAYYDQRDPNLASSSHGTSVALDDFMDTDENLHPQHQRPLSHLSSAGNHSPSSLHDSTVRGNISDALSGPTNQSLIGTQPREAMDENKYTPQAGHGPDTHETVPPARYSHQDGSNDIEEQMVRAAIEASLKELQNSRLSALEELDRTIFLSMKTAEEERAQCLQRDVGAQIGGPPIAASNERFQASISFFQDEAVDEEEQPLIRNRSTPLSLDSTNVIETITLSSSGNQDIHEEEPAPRPPSPSLIDQRLIKEQPDDEHLTSLQADKEKESRTVEEAKAAREEERRIEEESHEKKELERQSAAKEAALPPEPLDDKNAVTLLIRMPDGSRHRRRFLRSDTLQSVFDYIDHIGKVVKPGTYRLVRPYPRHSFSNGESALTLNEAGLTSKHETLLVELI